jgi:hypothetical protein
MADLIRRAAGVLTNGLFAVECCCGQNFKGGYMSLLTVPNSWGFRVDNYGTNLNAPGTTISAGVSNAEGTFVKLVSGSAITEDCYALQLLLHSGTATGVNTERLFDLRYLPGDSGDSGVAADVASAAAFIENIACGAATPLYTLGGLNFYFPVKVPKSASVWGRQQISDGTNRAIVAALKLYGQPSRPEAVWAGSGVETVGTAANSQGVVVTPGDAAYGSYVSLGTTTKACHFWQFSLQLSSATFDGEQLLVDVAYGDETNKVPILTKQPCSASDTAERLCKFMWFGDGYQSVPAGATIYMRAWCSNAPNADGTYNGFAHGVY